MDIDEIETPYLSEEVHLSKITPLRVIWAMFKLTSWQNFAHHPTCSVYKNHYFNLGRIKLCVGCTSLYSMLGGFLIAFFSAYDFFLKNAIILPIVYCAGIIALGLHLLLHPKNKWFKSLFRGVLGLAIGAYISIIVLGPTWWIRLILGLLIPVELVLFTIVRGKRANLELCETCPLHIAEPPCDPMKNTEIKAAKINQMIDSQIDNLKKYTAESKKKKEEEELEVSSEKEIEKYSED